MHFLLYSQILQTHKVFTLKPVGNLSKLTLCSIAKLAASISKVLAWLTTPESIFEKLLATLARLLILCLQIEQSVESVVNNIGEDWMEPLS